MSMKRIVTILLLCVSCANAVSAGDVTGADTLLATALTDSVGNIPEQPRESRFKRFIRLITEVDTNYIEENKYHAAAMVLGEKTFTTYRLSAKDENGNEQTLEFNQKRPFKVGPYIGYSLLFLGHTFDISANQFVQGHSEFCLSVYSRFIGIDYYYESGKGGYRFDKVSGIDCNWRDIVGKSFGGLHTYLQNWHVYYLFNNKRFSYPAAYSQTTNQRRSCGSFILGFNYTKERINFDYTQLPSSFLRDSNGNDILNEQFKIQSVKYNDYSLSLGYAYNWVFLKNCLANLTLSPTVGYNLADGEKFSTHEKLFKLDELNFDFITRASVVWNNSKYYAGAALVGHTYSYRTPTISIHNARFTLSLYAGFNFLRKKSKK